MVRRYDNKEAFDYHVAAQGFKDLGAAIQSQGLLADIAKPLDIKFVDKVAGYLSR